MGFCVFWREFFNVDKGLLYRFFFQKRLIDVLDFQRGSMRVGVNMIKYKELDFKLLQNIFDFYLIIFQQ